MKSKIRVEYDFEKKEPYLQLYVESSWHGESDMRDQMLVNFIEQAQHEGLYVIYPENNEDNSVMQIRITPKIDYDKPEDKQFD